jgi:Ser/Thr protein kinase RdoA (MazF antagonist)
MMDDSNDFDQVQAPTADVPYAALGPDVVLDAVESLGYLSDARIYPLNSYENRVYQVGIDESEPLIAKFYRPHRWTDEQIEEEHRFSLQLAELDIPVVPPLSLEGRTLFRYEVDGYSYRFALYPRKGGQAPELDNDDNLYTLGKHIGRIHNLGKEASFETRPTLDIETFGNNSREFLLSRDFIPPSLTESYATLTAHLLDKCATLFHQIEFKNIRLHGDCHPGNILWRDDAPNFVDLDDSRNGPAVQDIWMLLSGDRVRQTQQLGHFLDGYEEFCDFSRAELSLIEGLRSLRLMHYAAWLARRWQDPAFPQAFPWFNTERYWAEHILELREQMAALDEPPLQAL